jgi:RecB family endonuclease NucS
MKGDEIESLLTIFHEELISNKLSFHSRQEVFPGGRTDLIFEDKDGKLLVIEIKANKISRKDIGQLIEYWPKIKERYSEKEIRLMIRRNWGQADYVHLLVIFSAG